MIFNMVIFVCVIVVLIRHVRSTASLKKEAIDKKTIIRLLFSIGGVMFLFGLTWFFAILIISVPGLRETFQILFTIFNSLQGLFIFLFVCVISSDAQGEWKEVFTCSKFKSWYDKHSGLSAVLQNTNSTGVSNPLVSNSVTSDSKSLSMVRLYIMHGNSDSIPNTRHRNIIMMMV